MRSLSVVLVASFVLPAACAPPPAPAPVAATYPASSSDTRVPEAPADGLVPAQPTLRLPRNFVPTGYAAALAVDPAADGFDGTVSITGTVVVRSSVIWLHGANLTIARAVARGAGGETPLRVTPRGGELLEVRAATPLEPGTWTLVIGYRGGYELVNTAGVFKQVVDRVPYIYTQLEAVYARRTFPCIDEPDIKVPWQLTLDVPAGLVAVSNTPIAHEQALPAGRKRVAFATTRPLPTYLVAFGVGPFDVVDAGTTHRGTPVRMLALKGRARDAAWAARTTGQLLELLEELFGSPYPYEKIDMLSIPITVGFGAMENAGLITFAETLMLLDPARAAKQREYDWVVVAAHELAHQWFGNLVTMAWWDDIWLNEGFANWIEHKISARFEPAWREELAVLEQRNAALDFDSLVSARRIRQPIEVPDDIFNVFDGITYDKGASVLNMFEGYVGAEVFQRGVRDYLAAHRFGNATSTEFVAAISAAAGKDVGPAFACFPEQPGAPELTATLACDGGAPRLALSQRRHVPPGAQSPPAGTPWLVPVCVAFERDGGRAETCGLLEAATGSIALDAPRCPRWVMPNASGRGYYRVAYTTAQIAALRQAWRVLRPTEQLAVFFDASSAALLGRIPLTQALGFLPELLAAGDRVSIAAAVKLPSGLRDLIPEALRPRYEAWMRRTFGAAARRSGLTSRPEDSLDVEVARQWLVGAAAKIGHDAALTADAIQLAARWRDLPQAIRGEVLAIAAHASPAVFDRLLAEVVVEPDRDRRQQLLTALATTSDLAAQRNALALVLDPRLDIRDTMAVLFAPVLEANRAAAQQFFRAHKDEILARVPPDGVALGQAGLANVFTASCAPERRDELARYATDTFVKFDGGARVVQQAIEGMDQCIARRALIEPELRRWLAP